MCKCESSPSQSLILSPEPRGRDRETGRPARTLFLSLSTIRTAESASPTGQRGNGSGRPSLTPVRLQMKCTGTGTVTVVSQWSVSFKYCLRQIRWLRSGNELYRNKMVGSGTSQMYCTTYVRVMYCISSLRHH